MSSTRVIADSSACLTICRHKLVWVSQTASFLGVVCGGLRAGCRCSMPCRKITGTGSYTAQPNAYIRYAAELEAMAALDREYDRNPSPNLAQRAEYYNRQEYLQLIRQRLYSEFSEAQHAPVS